MAPPPTRVVITWVPARKRATTAQPTNLRLELDCSLSESHRRDVEVATHPLERGAAVTDHVRFNARVLDIVGVVSNTPIESRLLPSVVGGDPQSRAEDAFVALEDVMRDGTLCTIQTSLRRYTGMALISLAVPRDAPRGGVAELQMSWRELLFADTISVQAPEPKDASRKNRADVGKQGPKEAEAPVKESVLFGIKSALGG